MMLQAVVIRIKPANVASAPDNRNVHMYVPIMSYSFPNKMCVAIGENPKKAVP